MCEEARTFNGGSKIMNAEGLGCGRVHDSIKKLSPPAKLAALGVVCGILCFALPLAAQDKPDKEAAGGKSNKGAGIYFNAEASAKEARGDDV